MVSCTCGLLPNPAKVPNSKYKACWYSIDRKFHADDENTLNLEFEAMHPKNVLVSSVVHEISCLFEIMLFLLIAFLLNFLKKWPKKSQNGG
jgi:hypothetical protein